LNRPKCGFNVRIVRVGLLKRGTRTSKRGRGDRRCTTSQLFITSRRVVCSILGSGISRPLGYIQHNLASLTWKNPINSKAALLSYSDPRTLSSGLGSIPKNLAMDVMLSPMTILPPGQYAHPQACMTRNTFQIIEGR